MNRRDKCIEAIDGLATSFGKTRKEALAVIRSTWAEKLSPEDLASIERTATARDEYAQAQAQNPVLAAQYLQAHRYELYPEPGPPDPPTPAERQEFEAHTAAVREAFAAKQVERDMADLALYRQYRDLERTNYFDAAQLMNHNSHAILRGKSLDSDGEPPPKNAA